MEKKKEIRELVTQFENFAIGLKNLMENEEILNLFKNDDLRKNCGTALSAINLRSRLLLLNDEFKTEERKNAEKVYLEFQGEIDEIITDIDEGLSDKLEESELQERIKSFMKENNINVDYSKEILPSLLEIIGSNIDIF